MQTTMSRVHDPAQARVYFENKLAFTTGPVELDRWIKAGEDNLVVVDVRAAQDFAKGHIPGAINLPKEKWESLQGLSKDKTNTSSRCHRPSGRGRPRLNLRAMIPPNFNAQRRTVS